MQRVLAHAFFTGKKPARLPQEPAAYDVFLSYRKVSDQEHVDELASLLTAAGLRVWWDAKLVPGQDWLSGFCSAMAASRIFIPLISRGAMNATDGASGEPIASRHWASLAPGSLCDNVLLEWRLAVELREQGMLEAMCPVMIGDRDGEGAYGNFFQQGCAPVVPDIAVSAVEVVLREQVEALGMGMPLTDGDSATVRATWGTVTSHQGLILQGAPGAALSRAVDVVVACHQALT